MIIFINGPFGVGKTTVARRLVRHSRGGVIYDAELVGSLLRRVALPGKRPDDLQDLLLWRRLTVLIPRGTGRSSCR